MRLRCAPCTHGSKGCAKVHGTRAAVLPDKREREQPPGTTCIVQSSVGTLPGEQCSCGCCGNCLQGIIETEPCL